MCDACENGSNSKSSGSSKLSKRWKIWEIDSQLHCPIIGTCLSMDDLRKVTNGLGYSFAQPLSDYQLHSFVVSQSREKSNLTKKLNGLLERKFRIEVNRLSRLAGDEALASYWQTALNRGDVAGAFWALMTRTDLPLDMRWEIFGDVHMLSHLSGASIRAKVKDGATLSHKLRSTLEELKDLRQRSHDQIVNRDRQLQAVKDSRDALLVEVTALRERMNRSTISPDPVLRRRNDELESELMAAERREWQAKLQIQELQDQIFRLQAQVSDQQQHLTALRAGGEALETDANPTDQNLGGKSVLYVGGQRRMIAQLRKLVQEAQGDFLYHDGGLEDKASTLDGVLQKADCVFCPVDCVSHDACLQVKRYCKEQDKKLVFLTSSSVSSFARELNTLTPDQPNQAAE